MIKDYCYASQFDPKYSSLLYKLAEEVRLTHNQNLVDDFNNKCQQKWDDHNPILDNGIEFLAVSKADDLVVNAGIDHCINQILGTSVVRWQWMAIGTGVTAPAASQTALVTPTSPTVDMSLYGWREYAGATLRFMAFLGEKWVNTTVNEAGIYTTNALTPPLLNRNMFSNAPIVHVAGKDAVVISEIVEFVPVVD